MTLGIFKRADGSTYVTPVFALRYDGLRSEAIGLDEHFSKVQCLSLWATTPAPNHPLATRQLFIVQDTYASTDKSWDGEDWLLADEILMGRLLSGDSISAAEDPRFLPHTHPVALPAWFELKTERDIRTLQDLCYHFHDAYVLDYTEDSADLIIRFDTTWECYVTLRFCNVTEADFKEKVGVILRAEIRMTETGFELVVVDGFAGWMGECDYETETDSPYIRCQKILWQIEIPPLEA